MNHVIKGTLTDPFIKGTLTDPFIKGTLTDPFIKGTLTDPFKEGRWDQNFIISIYQAGEWLRCASEPCRKLGEQIFRPTSYQIRNFPFTSHNYLFEQAVLNLTVERMITYNGLQTSRLIFDPAHTFGTLLDLLFGLMKDNWGSLVIHTHQEMIVGQVDEIMRSVVRNPPGYGVGYFCLKLVQGIKLNSAIYNQIDGSASIQPKLPFSPDEYRIIKTINSSDDRIRLALLIVHELSQAQQNSGLFIDLHEFPNAFISVMMKRGFIDLQLFIECLLQTEKYFQMFGCERCQAVVGLWTNPSKISDISEDDLVSPIYSPRKSAKLQMCLIQEHIASAMSKHYITVKRINAGPNFPHQPGCIDLVSTTPLNRGTLTNPLVTPSITLLPPSSHESSLSNDDLDLPPGLFLFTELFSSESSSSTPPSPESSSNTSFIPDKSPSPESASKSSPKSPEQSLHSPSSFTPLSPQVELKRANKREKFIKYCQDRFDELFG